MLGATPAIALSQLPSPLPSQLPSHLLDHVGNPKLSFHTTKKVAVPSLQMGLAALFAPADPAVEPPVPTTQSAAAAIHTLRVALHWLKDKTGTAAHLDFSLRASRMYFRLPN